MFLGALPILVWGLLCYVNLGCDHCQSQAHKARSLWLSLCCSKADYLLDLWPRISTNLAVFCFRQYFPSQS